MNEDFLKRLENLEKKVEFLEKNMPKTEIDCFHSKKSVKKEKKCAEFANFFIKNEKNFLMTGEVYRSGIVTRNFKSFLAENLGNIQKKLKDQGYFLEIEQGYGNTMFYRCLKSRK